MNSWLSPEPTFSTCSWPFLGQQHLHPLSSSGPKSWSSFTPRVMHQDILPALSLRSFWIPGSFHHFHCFHSDPTRCLWPLPSDSPIRSGTGSCKNVGRITSLPAQNLPGSPRLTRCGRVLVVACQGTASALPFPLWPYSCCCLNSPVLRTFALASAWTALPPDTCRPISLPPSSLC